MNEGSHEDRNLNSGSPGHEPRLLDITSPLLQYRVSVVSGFSSETMQITPFFFRSAAYC